MQSDLRLVLAGHVYVHQCVLQWRDTLCITFISFKCVNFWGQLKGRHFFYLLFSLLSTCCFCMFLFYIILIDDSNIRFNLYIAFICTMCVLSSMKQVKFLATLHINQTQTNLWHHTLTLVSPPYIIWMVLCFTSW